MKFFTKFTVIYKGFWVKLKAIVVFAVENKKLTFSVILQTNFLATIGKPKNENGKKNKPSCQSLFSLQTAVCMA